MTGIIILAAGSSSRMGEPKQNLFYKGQTFLQIVITTALQCNSHVLAVVLGANADEIAPTLAELPVKIFLNDNWSEGMGSSIAFGLKQLLLIHPNLDNVIFLLTDQPFTSAENINNLTRQHQHGKIIASAYSNTQGPPVLFDKVYFGELLGFKGNEGAKKIISKYIEQVVTVPFEAGAFDIDTPEDYKRLTGDD